MIPLSTSFNNTSLIGDGQINFLQWILGHLKITFVLFLETCGPHEEHLECGSSCEPTCRDPHKFCYSRCVPGCFCKEGYLRDESTNACVPKHSCYKGKNKFFHILYNA